jgi:histone-lysine N-methyltransferase SETD3
MEANDLYMKLMKIILFLFSLYFFKYIIYVIRNQNSFKENISCNLNEFQNKFNLKNSSEVVNFTFESLNSNDNIELLYLRAKIYYNSSEYYKSLKDCEEYIKLSKNNKINDNIEIYQLSVLNYIKMFDLEKAKEVLGNIKGDNKYNKELQLLIEQEEKKNQENIKKYKQYPFYLNFMKTLYKNGLFLNKMEISFVSESYRLCHATENIYKKDLLLRVPLESLLTLEVAKKSEIGHYITQELEKKLYAPRHSLLTAFLMGEIDKGNQSKWKFYIDFLPSSYDSFPLFYKEKELEYLKGTQFLKSIEREKKLIKSDYNLLVKNIPGFAKYDLNFFLKIMEVVTSRVFGVKIHNKKETIIAPFADILNHKRPTDTIWDFDDKTNSFTIRSRSNVPKGEEVFDSYGIKSNRNYLLYYGFTINNNTYNKFKVDILLKLNIDQCFNIKQTLLGKNNSTKQFILGFNLLDKNVQNFFYNLRIILFNDSDCYLINQTYQINRLINLKIKLKMNRNKPFSLENEKNVFEKVKEIMTNYLKNYPTTLESDVKYFEENKKNMDFNQYNCYIIRIGEKEILNFYLNMANYILKLLNTNGSDIKILYDKLNSLNINKFRNKNPQADDGELFISFINLL